MAAVLLAICSKPLPVPSEWGPVPAGFDQWFAKACARDPSARFSSAKDAAQELRRLCEPEALEPLGEESSRIALRQQASAADTVVMNDFAQTDPSVFEDAVSSSSEPPRRRTVWAGAALGFLLTGGLFLAVRAAGNEPEPAEDTRPKATLAAERPKQSVEERSRTSIAPGSPETMAARPAEAELTGTTVTVAEPASPRAAVEATLPERRITRSGDTKRASGREASSTSARARRPRTTQVDLGF